MSLSGQEYWLSMTQNSMQWKLCLDAWKTMSLLPEGNWSMRELGIKFPVLCKLKEHGMYARCSLGLLFITAKLPVICNNQIKFPSYRQVQLGNMSRKHIKNQNTPHPPASPAIFPLRLSKPLNKRFWNLRADENHLGTDVETQIAGPLSQRLWRKCAGGGGEGVGKC